MLAKSATQLRVFSTAQQLKQAVQASYAIAKSHNLDDVCNFLIHREGMSPAKVQAMKEEYVRFIALAFNHHSSNKRIGISMVNTKNLGAIHIYKKCGFKIIGTEEKHIKLGENFYDCYIMQKIIAKLFLD